MTTAQAFQNTSTAARWVAAFDEAIAMGFTAIAARVIADATVRGS